VYNIDGVDSAREALEAFRRETGRELVAWLRSQADQFNFKEISARLG
jgi:hypothetical protein